METIAASGAVWSACSLLLASAVCDLRERRIPNAIQLALLGLFAVQFLFGACAAAAALWEHLAVGAVMLAAGYALYLTGRFGAGDGKLLAVSGLWIGPVELSLFMFAIAAGTFALCALALLPFGITRRMRYELPFAVSIALPAVIVLLPRALTCEFP